MEDITFTSINSYNGCKDTLLNKKPGKQDAPYSLRMHNARRRAVSLPGDR